MNEDRVLQESPLPKKEKIKVDLYKAYMAIALAFLGGAAAIISPWYSQYLSNQSSQKRFELSQKEMERKFIIIDNLQNRMADMAVELEIIRAENNKLQWIVGSQREKIQELMQRLDSTEQEKKDLEKKLSDLASQLNRRK